MAVSQYRREKGGHFFFDRRINNTADVVNENL